MSPEIEKRLAAIEKYAIEHSLEYTNTYWLCEQLRAAWQRIEELESLAQATRLRDFE